jgi:tetrahydromethanopterin S-methyltransferase subunit G
METKKVTITLTEKQQEKGKEVARDILGKENLSGVIGYLINEAHKKLKK